MIKTSILLAMAGLKLPAVADTPYMLWLCGRVHLSARRWGHFSKHWAQWRLSTSFLQWTLFIFPRMKCRFAIWQKLSEGVSWHLLTVVSPGCLTVRLTVRSQWTHCYHCMLSSSVDLTNRSQPAHGVRCKLKEDSQEGHSCEIISWVRCEVDEWLPNELAVRLWACSVLAVSSNS